MPRIADDFAAIKKAMEPTPEIVGTVSDGETVWAVTWTPAEPLTIYWSPTEDPESWIF